MLNKMKKGKQYFRIIMKGFDFTHCPERGVLRMPAVPRLYFDNCFCKDSTPHFDGNRFSRGLGYCATALAFNSTFLVSLNPEEMEERIASAKRNNMLAINSLRESLKGIEERISNSRQAIEDFKKQIELYSNFEVEDDLVAVLSEINKKYDEKVKDELEALQDEIDALEKQINGASSSFGYGLTEMYEKLNLLYKRLGNLEGDNDAFDVPSLETQRRELSNKIALYYKDLHYCDMWFDERADIVSRRINSLLSDCKISMWSYLKNGERVPDCVITNNNGVTYATLNTAHRIKTCIALQKMFCNHYGIEMPIFVDEASEFDSKNLPQSDGQIIYLLASDNETITVL